MELFVEPSCRRLVADHLGVGLEELVREVSLRDDLAADSLDLVELALALEAKFGISVSDRVLDLVRSYGDLVETTVDLIRAHRAAESRGVEQSARFVARVVPSGGSVRRHTGARRLAHAVHRRDDRRRRAARGPRRAA